MALQSISSLWSRLLPVHQTEPLAKDSKSCQAFGNPSETARNTVLLSKLVALSKTATVVFLPVWGLADLCEASNGKYGRRITIFMTADVV